MAILDNATCVQAWADEGITLTPADLKSELQTSGYFNELNQIDSNMHQQAGGLDFNGTGLVSFKMSGYLRTFKKAHEVSGDSYWVDRMEELLDWLFARTDEALWNGGDPEHVELLNIPWPDRDPAPMIPYAQAAGVPVGWDVNTPWCGWSRLFTVGGLGAMARAEPLTDGTVVADISCALKHMDNCGVGNVTKRAEWLSKIRCVAEGWKGNWVFDRQANIDPDCDGNGTTETIAGSFYLTNQTGDGLWEPPIAQNQNGIMLQGMLTLNECDSSICPDAKAMAEALIQDMKDYYFDENGAWYYRIAPCAQFEPHEDMGHFYITSGFISKAMELACVGAAQCAEDFYNGLINNAYLGGGDWSWLNSGQGVNGPFNYGSGTTNQQGTAQGVTDSSIGGSTSNRLFELPKVLIALYNLGSFAEGSVQLEQTRDAVLASTFKSPTMLESKACILSNVCDPPDPPPEPPNPPEEECETVSLCYVTNATVPDCLQPVQVCLVAGDGGRCVFPSTVKLVAKCPTGTRAVWSQLTGHPVEISETSNTEMEYTITDPHPLGYKFCAKCAPL